MTDTMAEIDGAVGYWHLEETPELSLAGVLRRDTNAGEWSLEVAGTLRPFGAIKRHGTIFGHTPQHLITLQNATLISESTYDGARLHQGQSSAQTWVSFAAIAGEHYSMEQTWGSLAFDLPFIWECFSPPPGGEHDPSDPLERDTLHSLSAISQGMRIDAWRSTRRTLGRRLRSSQGVGGYRISSEEGFTLSQVEETILALENLQHLLFGGVTQANGYTMRRLRADVTDPTAEYIFGRTALSPALTLPQPFFRLDEISFDEFIPAWIQLHTETEIWPTLGPPAGHGGWLQTQVVEATNSLEALSRHIMPSTSLPTDREREILEAIRGLNRRTRQYAASALRLTREPLSQRLSALAAALGEHSSRWLLGDATQWAAVVAHVRNALSHGYRVQSGLAGDAQVLMDVLVSVRVVQKLSMLRHAGYRPEKSASGYELLRSATGHTLIKYSNSPLAKDIDRVLGMRGRWPKWSSALGA